MCEEFFRRVVWKETNEGYEPLPYIFESPNCNSNNGQYPVNNSFPLYDQRLDPSVLNIDKIGSLVLPHHVTLKLYTENEGLHEIHGPIIIDDMSLYNGGWDHRMGHDCHIFDELGTNILHNDCGSKINFSLVDATDQFSFKKEIDEIGFFRDKSWDKMKHDHMHYGKHELTFYNHSLHTYSHKFDPDELYRKHCESVLYDNHTDFDCGCYEAYQELVNKYNYNTASTLHINNIDGRCDPDKYMPSYMRKGKYSSEECLKGVEHLVNSGLHDFRNDDTVQHSTYSCGHHVFDNVSQEEYESYEVKKINWVFVVCYYIISIFVFLTMIEFFEYYVYSLKKHKFLVKKLFRNV